MHTKRIAFALVLMFVGGVCLAQSSDEFGRATGGVLELSAKGPSRFSGSFGLSSTGGGLRGYGATFGGTVINDRLWFFGTAERTQTRVVSALPQTSPKIDANWNAALGSRNSFSASFRNATIPSSSFMTLHYTGIVSSNMFVTGSVTRN